MTRTQEIYEITTKEMEEGVVADFAEYIPIIKGLIREEDYEACEGIIKAVQDKFGVLLTITEWKE